MSIWLPPAHLALCLVIVLWDIVLAGRIARVAQAPRTFATLTGVAGLLVLPALVVALATTTVITGRAILYVDWIWPAVLAVFAAQSVYALAKRLVNPVWGVPIAVYNVLIASAGMVRYVAARGFVLPHPLLLLITAQTAALAIATATAAISNPLYLNVPMIAPAFPALRRITASFRALLSVIALGWSVGIATQLPNSIKAVDKYRERASEPLTERPEGDFAIGVKLFPDVASPPPPPAVDGDLTLADTLGASVVGVVVVPDVTNAVLDSLARDLDQLQRDSTLLIVTLGYHGKLLPELRRVPLDPRQRISAIRRIVRRLHPDILLPAEDPLPVKTVTSFPPRVCMSTCVDQTALPSTRWRSSRSSRGRIRCIASPQRREATPNLTAFPRGNTPSRLLPRLTKTRKRMSRSLSGARPC